MIQFIKGIFKKATQQPNEVNKGKSTPYGAKKVEWNYLLQLTSL